MYWAFDWAWASLAKNLITTVSAHETPQQLNQTKYYISPDNHYSLVHVYNLS